MKKQLLTLCLIACLLLSGCNTKENTNEQASSITTTAETTTEVTTETTKRYTIKKQEFELNVGESEKIEFAEELPKSVMFESLNTDIVTVTNEGVISAIATGNTTVKCTTDGNTINCPVIIKNNTTEKKPISIKLDIYEYKILSEDNLTGDEKWSSSNKDIVSVDDSGRIFGLKKGKATIKCKTVYETINYSISVSSNKTKKSTCLYDGDRFEFKDFDKKGFVPVFYAHSNEITKKTLEDWYFNYVDAHNYDCYIIVYVDKKDTGVYSANGKIDENVKIKITHNADTDTYKLKKTNKKNSTTYKPKGKKLVKKEDITKASSNTTTKTQTTHTESTTTSETTTTSFDDTDSYEVYITNTGSKYHRGTCSYLRRSKIGISKDDAIAQGYTPCSRCNP